MPSAIIAPEQLPPWALRTEIPTVVANLCEDACDLAVWRAIRWLIAISGRDRLGVDARTIAAHAKVDVKTALRCINGDRPDSAAKRRPRTLKRGLVGLGLLEVAGHQAVGKLKPRPVYRIPRWIEEQNAHYTRELLARLGVEPSSPAPPPAQTALPLGLDPPVEQARTTHGHLDPFVGQASVVPPERPDPFVEQTRTTHGYLDPNVEQSSVTSPGISGLAQGHGAPSEPLVPHLDQGTGQLSGVTDPYLDQSRRIDPDADQGARDITSRHQKAEEPLIAEPAPDPNTEQEARSKRRRTDPNSAHWMDGVMEGGREGITSPPPDMAFVPRPPKQNAPAFAGPTKKVPAPAPLGTLPPPEPPTAAQFAAHPGWGVGVLPAHPLDLWRRACSARRLIDDDQLAVLASEHDAATGGHGWYWVGRAILAAALSEDIHTVAKVRRTLDRWRSEDTYGSDAPAGRRAPAMAAPSAPRHDRQRPEPKASHIPLSVRLGLSDVFQEI